MSGADLSLLLFTDSRFETLRFLSQLLGGGVLSRRCSGVCSLLPFPLWLDPPVWLARPKHSRCRRIAWVWGEA